MMKMESKAFLGWVIALVLLNSSFAVFEEDFTVNWARENVVADDARSEVKLSLNEVAGAQFSSSSSFLFGSFTAKVKLVAGESAGTACSFYLTSYGGNHDEIDFEFLGNETGQPYLLHTNVFANGAGNREQRIFLWFDPTADFHNYSVIWNQQQITWLVDNIPIRVHKNIEDVLPNSYPHFQPMVVAASIFDASSWATRGGAVPTKWEHAPFVVTYKDFSFDACKVSNNDINPCITQNAAKWWEASQYQSLDTNSTNQLREVHQNYMVYDYCKDATRNPTPPQECTYNSV